MFPIPWNRAFRKKDGTLVNISDAMSGGGGESELPDYSVADAGKVLKVGDDGSLEWDTSGSGGGDAFVDYDFTKFGTRSIYHVDYSSAGATFSNDGKGCIKLWSTPSNMSSEMISDFTIYIDTGDLHISSGVHRRFLMISGDSGFIYRSTGVWSLYLNNWYDSEITDPTYFDNCTLKIYIDSDRKWHIYKDGVLVYEPNITYPVYELYLGMTSSSLVGSIIKALRIYNGNYTET